MTTGNTVAMTVSKGTQEPKHPDPECEELRQNNETVREAGNQHGAGSTVSSAKIKPAKGKAKVMAGASDGRLLLLDPPPGGLVPGGTDAQRNGEAPVMCTPKPPAKPYKHAAGGYGCHGEARILNELTPGQMAGATLTLNIDWRYNYKPPGAKNAGTYRSKTPCRNCYRALCFAVTHCGLKVELCTAKGKEPFQKPGEDCNATPRRKQKITASMRRTDPFESLAKRMGEPTPAGTGAL